ncbi:gamma-glutamyltransferase family protein [Ancylobacter sp. 6x-1]|uniref:Gamma-glutamyltransferase family protein n=1 Tax=Ancylobacter crimeensis TaxID=2579147 RepID=A0ABT0DA07_9HYPH|nr:gamma-glutamyltransferase family protein [Ancylobacter crimeensis]MCK0196729.1 gamma-glutamyltransferase family protein [Ancylobacter crimeensis]
MSLDRRDFFGPRRPPVLARDAMIATSHPFATAAGLEILNAGGSAVDAALAAVATQCVVDPHMTGIAGDAFILYAPKGKPTVALNGSGRAPAAASVAALAAAGVTGEIPRTSAHAVTVPGAVSAWMKLHGDYGRLELGRLFARAVDYARNGYPVLPRVQFDWLDEAEILKGDPYASALFLPGGHAPKAGDRHAQPLLADRLEAIAAKGASALYEGEIAAKIVRHLNSLGGLHTEEDFAEGKDAAFYTTPISANYRGITVEECPPNGQGVIALMILGILSHFDLGPDVPMADRVHIHAEATKLAYLHRDAYLSDPATMTMPVETLLAPQTTAQLAARIRMDRAQPPVLWNEPEHKDTVYVCAVDREGNMVSFINSIFHAFGSTRLVPDTGVLLHSRGASFRLIEGHPNAIGPRKRPLHTIIPGLLRKDGEALAVFGVMGGQYQAAGQAALISGIFDRGLDPQAAMDAPRSFAFNGTLDVEPAHGEAVFADLSARGHQLTHAVEPLGGSQMIMVDAARGCLIGGSDPRKDGSALGV